jgi:hypothetical protein
MDVAEAWHVLACESSPGSLRHKKALNVLLCEHVRLADAVARLEAEVDGLRADNERLTDGLSS